MDTKEVMRKYCNNCIHKKKCWRPCPTVSKELMEIENVKEGRGRHE